MKGNQKKKIILIGYRATGKSTVARELAKRWRFDWVDLDVWIENKQGASIAEIFANYGEDYFRDLEERAVADVVTQSRPLVVATGGGAPLRSASREIMKANGVVVWLTASIETIAKRMSDDVTTKTRRPALTDAKSPVAEIERVLTQREPYYRDAASFIVDTDGKSVDEIVLEIADSAPDFLM